MPFPPEATLGDVGEFGLIAELTQLFTQGEHVLVGPGDDAAVLRVRQGHVVVSTDLLIEGQHFRSDWVEAADVGHRAAAQNLSDINAMGGRAHSLTIGLGAPSDLPARWALDFAAGFAAECDLVGASVVGRRPDPLRPGRHRRHGHRRLHPGAGAPLRRAARRRAGADRPPGLVRRRAGRAHPRVPLAAGAGRGLPPPEPAVRRRPGRRRRRSHVDDRRLRRAAGRRRPPRHRLRGRDRRPHRARWTCPSRCTRSRRPPAPTRSRSSWAAARTTRCSRRSRTARSPTAGPSSARCPRATGVTVDGAAYDGETGWTHF